MAKLVYSRDEVMAEHSYAKPQIEAGYRLHGGFDAKGAYVSPRTLNRWPAVEAWQNQLKGRGAELIDASVRLLKHGNYPSLEQESLLLANGLGQSLWNSLTVTGVIEARGRALCDVEAPTYQDIIVEDLTGTCTGHLNKGLLYAHGLDEGGDPASKQGAHDAMWFAVRDLLFGKNAYPIPLIPESLTRPESGRRMPQIPLAFEQWTLLLMNILMIEVRAENFFRFCISVMRSPENFRDRRAEAMHAADLVDRIRIDEAIHVAYLQTFVSELRGFTFKGEMGERIKGATLIDPVWDGMVEWHTVTNAEFGRNQAREGILALIAAHPKAASIKDQFLALERKAAA
jgi:hypothetical protein